MSRLAHASSLAACLISRVVARVLIPVALVLVVLVTVMHEVDMTATALNRLVTARAVVPVVAMGSVFLMLFVHALTVRVLWWQ